MAGPGPSLFDPNIIVLSCHKRKGGEGVGEPGKECSREAMKGDTKHNCKQLPMELQSRDQKGVRGREWGRPETGENSSHLSSSQSTPHLMSIPFHTPLSHTSPWKPSSCLSTFQKALTLLPALRFPQIPIYFLKFIYLFGHAARHAGS